MSTDFQTHWASEPEAWPWEELSWLAGAESAYSAANWTKLRLWVMLVQPNEEHAENLAVGREPRAEAAAGTHLQAVERGDSCRAVETRLKADF